ncbi:MAG TPA: TonB-dependent receptor plug domain-containing protein [Oligoflexus sp.]|uniref:TonB-dependent receptor plug domain-containing protein n=1 Tax=Oligoflexus sp. TaxID=1971216 RepID=UPI002D23DA00|nr:TonB-dependent receptor plug domain-containing protein [Oligoflexus sp.]HYX33895.1 TonB-dependent receptor plug domain-containing protein [Oligoflexus sp.]
MILSEYAQASEDPQASKDAEAGTTKPEYMVVTARKREETITSIPGSVTTFSEQSLVDFNIVSFTDYATKTPNLSFAYGNGSTAGDPATAVGAARTIAIRGVAGARTTGFYLDETPIPNTVDLRVLDLAGIEVLKGPQGTLYGDGSLGGNVRLISKPPHLSRNDLRYMLGAGQTKGGGEPLNSTGEVAGNLVLSEGVAALRLATFFDDSAGYLTRTYLSDINDPQSPRIKVDNQGATNSKGGSISALWRISQDLDLGLRMLH